MEIELNFKISDFGVQLSDTDREKILISSLSFSFRTEVSITPFAIDRTYTRADVHVSLRAGL